MRTSIRAAALAVALAALLPATTGCAQHASEQIESATNVAVTTSLHSLPSVTGATVSETKTPNDTVQVALTTGLDRASPEDLASAAALLRQAAGMVYTTRHTTLDAVAVSVYGVNSDSASTQADSLLAQATYPVAALAPAAGS